MLAAEIVSTYDEAYTITALFQFIAWYRTRIVYRARVSPILASWRFLHIHLMRSTAVLLHVRTNSVRIDVVQLYNLIDTNTIRERASDTLQSSNTHTYSASYCSYTIPINIQLCCCWWRWSWAMTMPFIYSMPPVWKRQTHARTLHRTFIFSVSLFEAISLLHAYVHRPTHTRAQTEPYFSIWLALNVNGRQRENNSGSERAGLRERERTMKKAFTAFQLTFCV